MATIFVYIKRIWSAASDHVLQAGMCTNLFPDLVLRSTIVLHQQPATAAPAHVWQERGAVMALARQPAATVTLAISEIPLVSPTARAPISVMQVTTDLPIPFEPRAPAPISVTQGTMELPLDSLMAHAPISVKLATMALLNLSAQRATAPVCVMLATMALLVF
jgi:hypothetical protein